MLSSLDQLAYLLTSCVFCDVEFESANTFCFLFGSFGIFCHQIMWADRYIRLYVPCVGVLHALDLSGCCQAVVYKPATPDRHVTVEEVSLLCSSWLTRWVWGTRRDNPEAARTRMVLLQSVSYNSMHCKVLGCGQPTTEGNTARYCEVRWHIDCLLLFQQHVDSFWYNELL